MTSKGPVVDIHTHVYLTRYMDLLRSRSEVPRVLSLPSGEERLVILADEAKSSSDTSQGRPIGSEYYDISKKFEFMDQHGIDISVISLANPWLDFLGLGQAAPMARMLNTDIEKVCAESDGRLFAFGVLPLVEDSLAASTCVKEIENITSTSPHIRGIILGSRGFGHGLDDPVLDPVYSALEASGLMIFIHPHYGTGNHSFGPRSNGHVLPLALGFPFETTTAIARLILSGVLDRFPNLRILLAHSGGTLPFLAGRLDSCVAHDPQVASRLQLKPSEYLKKMYYDAVVYHDVGLKATAELVGEERVMFGTDHPFFPPLEGKEGEKWMSVTTNSAAVQAVLGEEAGEGVMGGNAVRILGLDR
ncbi:hypothetical protein YB2330_001332 [Saitoella coloradoensis]